MNRRPPRSTLFPTRRSSDLVEAHGTGTPLGDPIEVAALHEAFGVGEGGAQRVALGSVKTNIDRKSTRLNSSHQIISYAVFCLKKKNDVAFDIHHAHSEMSNK